MTIDQAMRDGTSKLTVVSDAPELEIERLLGRVCHQPESSWLYTHGNTVLSEQQENQLKLMLAERQTGKPLAYILGEVEFYGRSFVVTLDVLIPRPTTETLVLQALQYIETQWQTTPHTETPFMIADVGTGSGCIAITLALELSRLSLTTASTFQIIATDISPQALTVAQQNATNHGITTQITWLTGDLLTPLADYAIDLIVSNPPYVRTQELAQASGSPLTRGLVFEPQQALDGGVDGQRYVRQLAAAGIPAIVESTHGEIVNFNT